VSAFILLHNKAKRPVGWLASLIPVHLFAGLVHISPVTPSREVSWRCKELLRQSDAAQRVSVRLSLDTRYTMWTSGTVLKCICSKHLTTCNIGASHVSLKHRVDVRVEAMLR
jgi:hypothetical protein